jgi:hypothetical protein
MEERELSDSMDKGAWEFVGCVTGVTVVGAPSGFMTAAVPNGGIGIGDPLEDAVSLVSARRIRLRSR